MTVGLKERFAARQLPRVTVPLRMDFSAESDAAARALTAAEADLASALSRGLVDTAGLERRVDAARDALAAFYDDLVVCGLSPDRMDELVEAHPATKEQRTKNANAVWDPTTFVPALLAACVDSDMTEQDWAELTHGGPVTTGEVNHLVQTALEVNDRSPDPHLGKG